MDMQDSDLSSFCNDFREFLLQMQERKKRGHNDYNPLLCVQKMHDEVWMHSGMLCSLLDTRGLHYQENLFLDLFLKEINLKKWFGDSKNASVKKEYKNIDIFISNGKKHIILENKIWAGDQQGQIARYIQEIEKEYKTSDDNLAVIYLTLEEGKEPEEWSLSNDGKKWKIQDNALVCNEKRILYKQISYGKEIVEWLEKARCEVCNIQNLDSALGFYIDVLQQLLQTKENTMGVKGFFENFENENKEKNLEIALEILRNKKEILSVATEYIANCCKESGLEVVQGEDNSQLLFLSEDNVLCFGFGVECWEAKEGIRFSCDIYLEDYGFLEKQYYYELKDDKRQKFKKEMEEILEILEKLEYYQSNNKGIHCLIVDEASFSFSTLAEMKKGVLKFVEDNKERVRRLNDILKQNHPRIKEIYSSCLGINESN